MLLCDEFATYCQNFDFKIRRDHQKISYERRAYETKEPTKEPILEYVPKNDKKRIQAVKG